MSRRFLLWMTIICCTGVVVWMDRYLPPVHQTVLPQQTETRPFSLITGDEWSGPDHVPLSYHELAEFDGLTREQVMQMRKDALWLYQDLISGEYEYSQAVFGQIEDGLPWWGIEGQMCRGPGERSIEGLSEESRFLLNPLLLVMVNNAFSFISKVPFCEPVIPGPPLSAHWFPRKKEMVIVYDIASFLSRRTAMYQVDTREIGICPINARDFGYHYITYDEQETFGVTGKVEKSALTEVYGLQTFIHRGQSCGYPGGCNNGSPDEPHLDVIVESLPAQICARLWKQRPQKRSDPADVTVRIILK